MVDQVKPPTPAQPAARPTSRAPASAQAAASGFDGALLLALLGADSTGAGLGDGTPIAAVDTDGAPLSGETPAGGSQTAASDLATASASASASASSSDSALEGALAALMLAAASSVATSGAVQTNGGRYGDAAAGAARLTDGMTTAVPTGDAVLATNAKAAAANAHPEPDALAQRAGAEFTGAEFAADADGLDPDTPRSADPRGMAAQGAHKPTIAGAPGEVAARSAAADARPAATRLDLTGIRAATAGSAPGTFSERGRAAARPAVSAAATATAAATASSAAASAAARAAAWTQGPGSPQSVADGIAASIAPGDGVGSAALRATGFQLQQSTITIGGGAQTHAIGMPSPAPIPAAAPAPVPQITLAVPVNSPDFAPAFAAQVESLTLQGLDNAEIIVTPRDLGPIRIELSMSGENASIAFSAARPETREAIEQSLPTLRAMLSEQGLSLSQASVGHGGQNDAQHRFGAGQHSPQASATRSASGALAAIGAPVPSTLPATHARANGLVDLFA